MKGEPPWAYHSLQPAWPSGKRKVQITWEDIFKQLHTNQCLQTQKNHHKQANLELLFFSSNLLFETTLSNFLLKVNKHIKADLPCVSSDLPVLA